MKSQGALFPSPADLVAESPVTGTGGHRGRRTLVVTLSSPDKSKSVDLAAFGQRIADEIGRREGEGWRLVSTSVVNLRQAGTAANVVFQSGGQYATQIGAVIVYQREA